MKTAGCALLLLAIPCAGTRGQSPDHLGVKFAGTLAGQSFEYNYLPSLETKRRFGFGAAFFAEWSVHSPLSLIGELEIIQRGMGQDQLNLLKETQWNRVDYISIPVFAKATVAGDFLSPFFFAGPRLDFLVGYESDQDIFNGVYDQFRKTALGASVGIGAQSSAMVFPLMSVELRYNFDFQESYNSQFLSVRKDSFDLWLGAGW